MFRISDYADNWEILDDFPGIFICTAASRPTLWGANQAGLLILETDTDLIWQWTGSAWQRMYPKGLLAQATFTANDVSTTSTTFNSVLDCPVTVPDGGRQVMIVADASGAYNTNGTFELALFRDAAQLQSWFQRGKLSAVASEQPEPINKTIFDLPTIGAHTYSLQFRCDAIFLGTSTVQASATKPISVSVVEV